ncbi:hypothetical protein ACFV7Q_20870 [Streptomyces sp. NPDC059851]|uniref:hypothetical protein n=1 Tax=Streptomyces sp. NPDC059851 TaxID=3346971 RepID=UPI00365E580D
MTEPVTTPPPVEPPPPGRPAAPGVTAGDVRDGAAVTLAVGASGALLGLLWSWLAPRAEYVSNGQSVFLRNTESEARIGADGMFLLLSVGLGVLAAVLLFLWRRRGGVPQVIGLGIGSCFAAVLAWRTGEWLGGSGDVAAAAVAAGKGVPFDAPLELLAHGALLALPMSALLVHLGLTALWTPHDPEPGPGPDGAALPGPAAVYPPPHVHADPAPQQPPRP